MAELMGIPEQFNFNAVGQSLMSEIIGQSVEYPMHDILINEIKELFLSDGEYDILEKNIFKGLKHILK